MVRFLVGGVRIALIQCLLFDKHPSALRIVL